MRTVGNAQADGLCGGRGRFILREEIGYGGKIGAPGKIRTPDPQIRSLVLYPAELPELIFDFRYRISSDFSLSSSLGTEGRSV